MLSPVSKNQFVWLLTSLYVTMVCVGQGLHFVPGFRCVSHHCGTSSSSGSGCCETLAQDACISDCPFHVARQSKYSSELGVELVEGSNAQLLPCQDGECTVCKLLSRLASAYCWQSHSEVQFATTSSCVLLPNSKSLSLSVWFQSRAPPFIA